MKEKISLLIVDDHSMMRIGLTTAIAAEPDMAVVAEATTGEQALELYQRQRPDVVLMDLRLPGISGAEATALLCRKDPRAKVLMLSKYDSPADISRCARAGARSFLSKNVSLEELLAAIRAVHAELFYLPSTTTAGLVRQNTGSSSNKTGPVPLP